LQKYKDTLIDNGVEDLETILELDEKHLEMMSIPLGHKLKILKRIKDVRKDTGMSMPESRQGKRADAGGNNVEASTKTFIQREYEALPEPNMTSGGVGTANDDSNMVTQKSGGTGGDSLLAGAYDEANSHN